MEGDRDIEELRTFGSNERKRDIVKDIRGNNTKGLCGRNLI